MSWKEVNSNERIEENKWMQWMKGMNGWMDGMKEWMSEWIKEWIRDEWMNEWMNE